MPISEQDQQIRRVSASIAGAIIEFCAANREWHADDLRRAVARQCGATAPASADRVLRDLRRKRRLNYRVLSRSESLYETMPVTVPSAEQVEMGL